jgi:hypothetical protein
MNSALIRFVAGYLADHAARADAGNGALGRVRIDPQFGHCLELRAPYETKDYATIVSGTWDQQETRLH